MLENNSIVELFNISKTFSGIKALDNIDFSIKAGEIHCLMGENGCGKSTLIKIISGVLQPDHGARIYINQKEYKKLNIITAINEGIEVIFQDLSLFPNLTIKENIALNERIRSKNLIMNWKETKKIAVKTMADIGIELDPDLFVRELPIAQKQLVAILRAITKELKLLIMDEPTSSLTKKEVDLLFKVVRSLNKKGISILFISHKINEVLEITNRVTVLRDGKKAGILDSKNLDSRKISQLMLGKEIDYPNYRKKFDNKEVVLKVEKFTKKNCFKDISFDVFSGEILGITGLLGSGRTELALSLYGLYKVDSGKIFINGNPVEINTTQDAMKYGIAYVPEDRLNEGLFLSESIAKNIVVNSLGKVLNRIKFISKKKIDVFSNFWLREFGINSKSNTMKVSSLSGGNQQRVVLAKWIATNPKILILDGPTIGVDIGAKFKIYEIIREFSEKGIGILLISDEIEEVYRNCSRVLIMKDGKIVELINTDEVEIEKINEVLSEK